MLTGRAVIFAIQLANPMARCVAIIIKLEAATITGSGKNSKRWHLQSSAATRDDGELA